MINTIQTVKLSLILTLIVAAAYIVVEKNLFEGLVFFMFGFLALYLWIFLECCWTEKDHCQTEHEAHHPKKQK